MDNFRIYDTMFRFNNETERPSGVWRRNQKFVHDAYFWKILNMLKDEGFDVHHDESVSKIIRRNYIEGIRRDLKFKAQRFPAGFEIVFYQDIVHENPHGGFYDFDKRQKMPYLIGLQYEKYMNLIVKKIKSLVEVEDAAGPYSGHGTARCGRGRFYRPVEAAKAPISSSSRVRACRGAHQ